MAPTPLKRFTALQNARLAEIQLMSTRWRDRQTETLNKNIVDSRIGALNVIWSEARQTHAIIVIRDDAEADPYIIDNVFPRLQAVYEDFLDVLLTKKAQLESNNFLVDSAVPINNNTTVATLDMAKLPKLDLPKFSGNYEDWESFSDLFVSLIHSKNATDATKLSYLKLCLTGIAADLVKDVATTDANYMTTWQSLKQRFYNPRLIVSNHLNAIMNIPALKKESAILLRSFADEAQRTVRALSNLKMPIEHWNIWLTHILSAKLDAESRKLWETELSTRDRIILINREESSTSSSVESVPLNHFPKFSEFVDFLEKRSQTLSMIASENNIDKKLSNHKQGLGSRKVLHAQQNFKSPSKCALCSGIHYLWKCHKLKTKSPYDRRSEIRRLKLCFNCFGKHNYNTCNSKVRCSVCQEKHHTLLHFNAKQPHNSPSSSDRKNESFGNALTQNVKALTANIINFKHSIILATAQVIIQGPCGRQTQVRALLDQGSEATFITESVAQLLELPRRPASICLSGLGESSAGKAKTITSFKLQSIIHPSFQLEMQALVLPRLTSHLPMRSLIEIDLSQFASISLADPHFHIKDSVDLILGADVYGQLLRSEVRSFRDSNLTAQCTSLGWILSGSVKSSPSRRAETSARAPIKILHYISGNDLNDSLQKFWNLEEIPDALSKLKPEEEECELRFKETISRDSDGRFVVNLPLKSDIPAVAIETRYLSYGSLKHLYNRFSRDTKLAEAYREFMDLYERLGHMSRIPAEEIDNSRAWYLPHHAVVRTFESNFKLRVVFDASRLTRDKHCLNKFLMPGPALQSDLGLILLNWRYYRYVFTADIIKMFRQIRVIPKHQDFQRILWSPSPNEPPVEYRLTTVTYGTSCAPYLAIRALLQLAEEESLRFPLGAKCIKNNMYVDDIFSGADELSVAVAKRKEIVDILKSAGIELDKWAANHGDLLPAYTKQTDNKEKSIDKDAAVKTLGILWDPKCDVFSFSIGDLKTLSAASTKRALLSSISRLFDPLGWLSPITVIAKILIQDLWLLKCEWDSSLPLNIRNRWVEYCNTLSALSSLHIERWLGSASEKSYQLHGFADASCRAYAAAVYLRVAEGENVRVILLAAKSKVAPIKTISVPNLELCGAVLLVKLLIHLQKLDLFKNLSIYTWSDSQVVLTWLRKHPRYWKTFVANRVSYIQTELPSAIWSHISTKENPADVATRGCKPSDLIEYELWWHGPRWLSSPSEGWPAAAASVRTLHSRIAPAEPEIIKRYSSLTRLLRVVAYCLRPLINLRRRKSSISALPPFLTTDELTNARNCVIKLSQAATFEVEITCIKNNKQLNKQNILRKLNPILDKDGILRVGGRLAHSGLSSDPKNPPILAHYSNLSLLIVRQAHFSCLHGGPTLTSSIVTRHAWILGRKRLVKNVIRNCITCQRVKPRMASQLMGNLPAARVTPARPFSNSGLDYAGPILVRTSKGRGHKAYKGYIALFVCFATRAVHLELVSDCTTAMFLAAYRRFVSRRGICRNLFSDNATTFHGADNELRNMFKAASDFYKSTAALLANDGTNWNFIPPNSPHYGGLWEAGIKSTKHHLKRVIGEHTLTFEELSTLLTEIEACLNSRPLSPMSNDMDDMYALTPAHFLIVESSGLIPVEEPPKVPETRPSRFQLMQRIRNNFWKRWSREYLQHLQERTKWKDPMENFAVGQLVLVVDERYPPAKWPLGRVIEVHYGSDGLVRVATVKTSTTILKRHIVRLCPLSTAEELKKK